MPRKVFLSLLILKHRKRIVQLAVSQKRFLFLLLLFFFFFF